MNETAKTHGCFGEGKVLERHDRVYVVPPSARISSKRYHRRDEGRSVSSSKKREIRWKVGGSRRCSLPRLKFHERRRQIRKSRAHSLDGIEYFGHVSRRAKRRIPDGVTSGGTGDDGQTEGAGNLVS